MSSEMLDSLPISLVRQYIFCPRIPWFMQNLTSDFRHPLWVKQGSEHEERRELLLGKRPLFKHEKLTEYRQKFSVYVSNPTLGIHGKVDVVIETDNETIPVEVKMSDVRPQRGHILQLMGYALCLESHGHSVRQGIIVFGKRQRRYMVEFTAELREEFLQILSRMRSIMGSSYLPHSSASLAKCLQCEYQNFCQDRDI